MTPEQLNEIKHMVCKAWKKIDAIRLNREDPFSVGYNVAEAGQTLEQLAVLIEDIQNNAITSPTANADTKQCEGMG